MPFTPHLKIFEPLHTTMLEARAQARAGQPEGTTIMAGYAGELHMAIGAIEELADHHALRASHLPMASLAHLVAKAGDAERARGFAAASKAKGGTPREHRLMDEQVERLLSLKRTRIS